MLKPIRNILVMRGGALGDFVLTLPALAALRRRHPGAQIELRTRLRHAWLARDSGLADRVADIEAAEMAEAFTPAPAPHQPLPPIFRDYFSQFDLVISYLADRDGSLARNLQQAGIKYFIAIPARPAAGEHAADAWRRPLLMPGANPPPAVPQLRLPENILHAGRVLLENITAGRPAVILHPGSGSRAKNWPLPRFLALATWLRQDRGWQPVFLLGEAESNWPPTAMAAWPTISQPALPAAAGILAHARLYVGNDSGITHLAAGLGAPVVALFGPTDPAAWGPRGVRVRILRATTPAHAMPSLTPAAVRQACMGFSNSDDH